MPVNLAALASLDETWAGEDVEPGGTLVVTPEQIANLKRSRQAHAALVHVLAPHEQRGAVVIGRAPECEVVLNDHSVSRRHAELHRQLGHWLIEDLDSQNGTSLDGTRLSAGAALPLNDRQCRRSGHGYANSSSQR